ncbi:MAG: FAD-binding oxidoreductase [Alphaproteobacteria bacterium]|nr:FAD-binding oxidoreductase [Alphaproteobacteria bacterium]
MTAPLPGPEALPTRADVLVIGGGLAGICCALALAEAGVDTLLVEARDALAAGATGRAAGLVQVGTDEPPQQLTAALGLARARAVAEFTLRSADFLRQRVQPLREGGLRVAMLPQERAELDASVEAARALGLEAERWSEPQVAAALGVEQAPGPARFCPQDLQVDPVEAAAALADQALAAGARLHVASPLEALDAGGEAPVATVAGRPIRAELVVFAAGAGLLSLDRFFAETLYPVRGQCVATEPLSQKLSHGGSGQMGYLYWNQRADGALVAGGARWATPHMETFETDDAVIQPAVDQKIVAFVRQTFGEVGIARRWSRVMAYSCDNLPLVGPLPGRVRLVACCGFNGQQWSYAPEAARCVARGITEGTLGGIPPQMLPGRMI